MEKAAQDHMAGVVLPGGSRLEFVQRPLPAPGPAQVLVATMASGLCGSDLRAIYRPTEQGHGPEAYKGVIAGHEPAGVIEEVGPGVTGWRPGDRVVLYHIAGCGECSECQAGWMISCTSPRRAAYGWQRDGGHAPYILAETSTLVALPDGLTFVDGALVACGYGTAYAACLRAGIAPGEKVLVTGLGPVGLGAALLARAMGADVVAVEANDARAAFARGLGIDAVGLGPDLEGSLKSRTGAQGFEVTIDCSAAQSARVLTLTAAARWGRVVWIGEGGSVSFEPSPLLLHKQLTLHGSWVCSIGQMRELVGRLVDWQMHPEEIVSHRFSLGKAREAYQAFDAGTTGKVVITFDP